MLAARARTSIAALGAVAALTVAGPMTHAGADDDRGTNSGELSGVLECVAVNADGTFTALFGTNNTTGADQAVPVGERNYLTPSLAIKPITSFPKGRAVGTFKATWDGKTALVWHTPGGTATANRNSKACASAPVVSEARTAAILAVVAGGLGLWWFNRRRVKLTGES